MNLQEKVRICQQCSNRKFDYQQGILCNLSGKKAEFGNECPSFIKDENAKPSVATASYAVEATDENAQKDMLIGALWCIGGIGATIADFGLVFYGAIIFGAIQFFKGVMNSR